MSDILDNGLVRKYFGAHPCGHSNPPNKYVVCEPCISQDVLRAMQEPIRKGERFLELENDGTAKEDIANTMKEEMLAIQFRPFFLRLPDAFQPQRSEGGKECECLKCRRAEARYCRECAIGEFSKSQVPKCDFGCGKYAYVIRCPVHGTKPSPAPERCPDSNSLSHDRTHCNRCMPERCGQCGNVYPCCHKPSDAVSSHSSEVEAKIDAIELKVWKWGKATVGEAVSLGRDLRELVNLVKASVRR